MDWIIVMDDVSGVADISKNVANFLTVSRKYRYHCVYVFHIIAPATQSWQKIISQTIIFNIFPSSVLYNTVAKILQSNCKQQYQKYVPARSMWLNRIFINLAKTGAKHCLTNDCRNVNKNRPGRYRTSAYNPDQQVCHFNQPHDDELYNVFISKKIKTENFEEGIYFRIDRVQGKLKTRASMKKNFRRWHKR